MHKISTSQLMGSIWSTTFLSFHLATTTLKEKLRLETSTGNKEVEAENGTTKIMMKMKAMMGPIITRVQLDKTECSIEEAVDEEATAKN